jgi:ABC-2 type transport system ATP-binding protein
MAAIFVEHLTKKFGNFTAVEEVSFEARRGEIFGLLGPNGSGKTTTIRMMLGLLVPTTGHIEVLGTPINGSSLEVRARIGYMSQKFSLYNDLTVLQNLRFYGAAYGLRGETLRARVHEALIRSGLNGREDAKTKDLSGGWRQRLALSAAILHRPEVIFLDEPTAGVDPISRRAFWDLLYELAAEGITIFVTTHYMDEAEHCHRLAFLQRGRRIAYGSPEEIKREKMRGEVLEIETEDAAAALRILRAARDAGTLPLEDIELYGALVHAITPNAEKLRARVARTLKRNGTRVHRIEKVDPSLEDVFIAAMR